MYVCLVQFVCPVQHDIAARAARPRGGIGRQLRAELGARRGLVEPAREALPPHQAAGQCLCERGHGRAGTRIRRPAATAVSGGEAAGKPLALAMAAAVTPFWLPRLVSVSPWIDRT